MHKNFQFIPSGGGVSAVYLLGGEPLLHPQISEISRITRRAFPDADIFILTNGILLPSMPEEFWETCRDYKIIIRPTVYPIKIDYEKQQKFAEEKGVSYILYPPSEKVQWKWYPIRTIRAKKENFMQEEKQNFIRCQNANNSCITLKDGKLYTCQAAAHAIHLKKYFNLDIKLSDQDGVDIYSAKTGDEILERLARPISFCQYCDVTNNLIECKWGPSRKDRYEWLEFEFKKEDIEYLKSKAPIIYIFGAGRWGKYTITKLREAGIPIKMVLATRTKGKDHVLDIPLVDLCMLGEVEANSICLVALSSPDMKDEVYPLLSKVGFGDIVPVQI